MYSKRFYENIEYFRGVSVLFSLLLYDFSRHITLLFYQQFSCQPVIRHAYAMDNRLTQYMVALYSHNDWEYI